MLILDNCALSALVSLKLLPKVKLLGRSVVTTSAAIKEFSRKWGNELVPEWMIIIDPPKWHPLPSEQLPAGLSTTDLSNTNSSRSENRLHTMPPKALSNLVTKEPTGLCTMFLDGNAEPIKKPLCNLREHIFDILACFCTGLEVSHS